MTIRNLADLSCKEFVELVTDYMTESMPDEDRIDFEKHMYACTWCLTYFDQMKASIAASSQLNDGQLSNETKAKLRLAFRAWRAK